MTVAPRTKRTTSIQRSSLGIHGLLSSVSNSALELVLPLITIRPLEFRVYPCADAKSPGTLKVPVWLVGLYPHILDCYADLQ
jgi:hypothetical protein